MSTRSCIVIILLLILALAGSSLLSGCAAETTTAVCEIKLLGQSERGNPVILQACQSPEAFKAAQQ